MRFQKGQIPWNKGLPMPEGHWARMYNAKLLKIIRKENTIAILKARSEREDRNLYPCRYNENYVIDIRL